MNPVSILAQFPADSVLIERGKYSTLASERRALLKDLRDGMEAIADHARRVLRNIDDVSFAQEEAVKAALRITLAQEWLVRLHELANELDILRPAAWGKEKPE